MFNESRLLDCVSYGSQYGHEFNTRVTTLRSGHERRNVVWQMPLGRFSILYNNLKPEQHAQVKAAHMASLGSAIPFRLKDWTDYQAEGEVIGEGTGAEQVLQLTKQYSFGPLTFQRKIFKPVVGTVSVFEDGQLVAAVVDYTTGLVTVTAPPGSTITWAGEFDVPVRFVSDRLDYDPVAARSTGFILSSDVELTEVRL